MKKKVLNIFSLICNISTIALVTYSVACFFVKIGDGNMSVGGSSCFRYFTIDSNILAAITCLIVAVYNILILCNKKQCIAKFASILKLIGTTAVSVTFLTVIFFLGPTQGYNLMFLGNNLFLHLLCPLLCIISYICLENTDSEISYRNAFYGVLPTAIYGIIYISMSVFIGEGNGGWPDFYGFNMGGMWYISTIVMVIATLAISFALYFLNKIFKKLIYKNR